jgi:hypothetical protein
MQLSNISHMLGKSLKVDPQRGTVIGEKEADKLWSREYAKGWELKA